MEGGFGDFFGAIGDFIGAIGEAKEQAERVADGGGAAFGGRNGTSGEYDRTATVDRVLCGARNVLNVNDR
ncbi:MAG: hypothetical protein JOZ24_06265 [Candidatus Eremiobacteraeota bacterium]|nr:hypothetical protein [Candidatus Eremiobacteraeota bacterium]